ncbi:MAG: Hsp70 family protein, partial [Clostridia bacterium]|nr:Hsp70 family protein [Clostridia bacterium]
NLSDEDIDKAVKEAEQYAEQDKKEKEKIEIRNNADTAIYTTEKSLKDLGDKVSEDDKKSIQEKIDALKEVLNGDDTDKIKDATEQLSQTSYDVFGKIYAQAQQEQQAAQQAAGGAEQNAGPSGDNVVDADYEVVDDDKDNK